MTGLFKIYVLTATGNHHCSKGLKIKQAAVLPVEAETISEMSVLRAT